MFDGDGHGDGWCWMVMDGDENDENDEDHEDDEDGDVTC